MSVPYFVPSPHCSMTLACLFWLFAWSTIWVIWFSITHCVLQCFSCTACTSLRHQYWPVLASCCSHFPSLLETSSQLPVCSIACSSLTLGPHLPFLLRPDYPCTPESISQTCLPFTHSSPIRQLLSNQWPVLECTACTAGEWVGVPPPETSSSLPLSCLIYDFLASLQSFLHLLYWSFTQICHFQEPQAWYWVRVTWSRSGIGMLSSWLLIRSFSGGHSYGWILSGTKVRLSDSECIRLNCDLWALLIEGVVAGGGNGDWTQDHRTELHYQPCFCLLFWDSVSLCGWSWLQIPIFCASASGA